MKMTLDELVHEFGSKIKGDKPRLVELGNENLQTA
jgi:hypothetical protein